MSSAARRMATTSALVRMAWYEFGAALRAIVARPAFSALVVAVLAAGLACAIVGFALLDCLALRPLPFASPQTLYRAGLHAGGPADAIGPVSNRDVIAIRERLADVADVAAAARSTMNLGDLDRPERVNGARVSANLFHTLGVAPQLGRDFTAGDEQAGAPAVAMLSHALWQDRYGGAADVVGRSIRVDARQATVIGVMPADFSFPRREVLWLAATLDATQGFDQLSYWLVLRRHAGAAEAALRGSFAAWHAAALRAEPERFRGSQPQVQSLHKLVLDDAAREQLELLLAAVGLVLLVACANAANLLLTRTLARRSELALRVALGAGRARLVTHVLAHGLLLAVAALLVALPLARAALEWQRQLMRESEFTLLWVRSDVDVTVGVLALSAVLLVTLGSAILPALHAARTAPAAGLRDAGARATGSAAFARICRALVIGEIAASCALVICAGVLVRGIVAVENADLGIDTQHLLTARVLLPEATYANAADQARAYERIGERLRAEPGVVDASVGTALPGTYYNEMREILADGDEPGAAPAAPVAFAAVDDHFPGAYGVALAAGRFFDARDARDAPAVAVVDRRFAARYASGEPLLGRRFRFEPRDDALPAVTIVGIVEPLLLDAPGRAPPPLLMLVPLRQEPFKIASVAVRTRDEAAAFAPRLAVALREVAPDAPPYWVRDYTQVMRSMSVDERAAGQRFFLFASVALLLAGAGLYGVMAFAVSQRLREIGVRRALGASRSAVLRALFARNVGQLAAGLALGLAAGLPLARHLGAALRTGDSADPGIVLTTLGVLAATALLAAIVPARRALRIDPVDPLRHE